jgi:hypothetical protein
MKPTESIARRLSLALDHLEQAWIGKTVGISYDIDTETGRVKLSLEPAGDDANTLTIHADVRDIRPGRGNDN